MEDTQYTKYTSKKLQKILSRKMVRNPTFAGQPSSFPRLSGGPVRVRQNILYVYENSRLHNNYGPAIVVLDKNGKISTRHYYSNGNKLPCNDIKVRLIQARERSLDAK